MNGLASAPSVALVVLNWNGKEDTLRCLESLGQATYPNVSIIVVDNGSSDGSCAAVLEAYPSVELLALPSNLGYTGGNNAGIQRALDNGAELVGVLNNDTVVDPGFLEPLVEQIALDGMTFVSPRIVYLDDPAVAWFGGSYIDPTVGIVYHQAEGRLNAAERAAAVRETVAVTGCCLLAHRRLWERVGLFDDRYFLIFEDADWCARARRVGARGLVVTGSTVRHAVSATFHSRRSTVADYYYARNGLLYLRDHGEARVQSSLMFLARVLRGSSRNLFRDPNAFNAQAVLAQLAGVGAFLGGRLGQRRQELQRRWRRVTQDRLPA